MEYCYRAQICLNGHCTSSQVNERPELSQKYCNKCGARTIEYCPSCNEPIRGWDPLDGMVWLQGSKNYTPLYCESCGNPYPWVQTAIEAAAELIQEESNVNGEEKDKLVESLPDLITETPKSNLAVSRVKRFFSAAGRFAADGVRQFAIDFGCEFVKQQLGL